MKTPAHKNTKHPPGQIVNDITLADYIRRKNRHEAFEQVATEKKLTFDAWWFINRTHEPCWRLKEEEAWIIWKAAQENK